MHAIREACISQHKRMEEKIQEKSARANKRRNLQFINFQFKFALFHAQEKMWSKKEKFFSLLSW
jgi:hypothetical protein